MNTFKLTFALILAIAIGCTKANSNKDASPEIPAPIVDRSTVELIGIAAHVPSSAGKVMTDALNYHGSSIQFHGEYTRLSEEIIGTEIQVTGRIVKKHSPMFIERPGTQSPQGIPMPPGTDIEKESVYFVIENPQWQIIANDHADAG